MKKYFLGVMTFLSIFIFIGCAATVPLAPPDADKAAKKFETPPEGFAGVYIYRINAYIGQSTKFNLFIDEQAIGELAPGTYHYKKVTPGKHKISTDSEFKKYSVEADMEEGKNYYFLQYMVYGIITAQAELKEIPEKESQQIINIISKLKLTKVSDY